MANDVMPYSLAAEGMSMMTVDHKEAVRPSREAPAPRGAARLASQPGAVVPPPDPARALTPSVSLGERYPTATLAIGERLADVAVRPGIFSS